MTTTDEAAALASSLERVIFRRILEKRLDGYTLETGAELAQVALATLTTERDRLRVDAVGALIQARNDLLEVGNDYPGSSCQKWCTERAANAWNALKPWRHCPSTHCERAEECRSVNECSAEKSTARAFLTATARRQLGRNTVLEFRA